MPSKVELTPMPNADFSGGGIFDAITFKDELAGTISSIYYYSSPTQSRDLSFSTLDEARDALNGAINFYEKTRGTQEERKIELQGDPDPDLKARVNIQRSQRLISSLEAPKDDLDAFSRDITIILCKGLKKESARQDAFADLERLAQKQGMLIPQEVQDELADYRREQFSFKYPSPPDILWDIGSETSQAASRIIANKRWFYNYIRDGSTTYVRRELGTVKKFYDTPSGQINVASFSEKEEDLSWVLANLQGDIEFVLPKSSTVLSLDEMRKFLSENTLKSQAGENLELIFVNDYTVFLKGEEAEDERKEREDEREEHESQILHYLQGMVNQERADRYTITHVREYDVKVEDIERVQEVSARASSETTVAVPERNRNTFRVNIHKPGEERVIEDTVSVDPRIGLREVTDALVYQQGATESPLARSLFNVEIMHRHDLSEEEKKDVIITGMRRSIKGLERDYLNVDVLENWLVQKRATGQLPENVRLIVTNTTIDFPGFERGEEGFFLVYPPEFNEIKFFYEFIQPHLQYKPSGEADAWDVFKRDWRGFEEVK